MTHRIRLSLLCGLALLLCGCANNQPASSEPPVVSTPEASSVASSEQTTSSENVTSSSEVISSDEATSSKDITSSEVKSSEAPSSSDAYEPSEQSSEPSSELSSEVSSQTPSSESSKSSSSQPSSSQPSSSQASSSQGSASSDEHWNVNFNEFGQTFMVTLSRQIIASGKVTSYADQKTIGPKAAAFPDENSNTFIPFYKEPTQANVIAASNFNNPTGWNREHTWPNSRGGGSFENDAVMIRPAAVADNSDRGNNFYGIGSGQWDPASCGYEQARGESARIILYCATAYYNTVSLSNNPADSATLKTMGTLRTLLEWNRQYQPSDFEKLVNERLDKYGYRRNPFVDHPEYADYIWDDQGIRTTPYGNGDSSSIDSSDSSLIEATGYQVITDADELVDGKEVLIVAEAADAEGSYASLSDETWNDYYLAAESGAFRDGVFTPNDEPTWWTLHIEDEGVTFTSGEKKLGVVVNGTHKNLVAVEGELEDDLWKLNSLDSTSGKASLINVGTNQYPEYYRGSFSAYGQDKGLYFCA